MPPPRWKRWAWRSRTIAKADDEPASAPGRSDCRLAPAPRFAPRRSAAQGEGCAARLPDSLGAGGLEELDRVAGGVVEQDLLAARAADDVVAEGQPRGTQPL